MTHQALIIGSSPVQLWGLDTRTRVERQLGALGIVLPEPGRALPESGSILVLNADYLFEQKTLKALSQQTSTALLDDQRGEIAAALVDPALVETIASQMMAGTAALPTGVCGLTVDALDAYDDHLRRSEPPLLIHAQAEDRAELEALLYGNAYKGITDFVTKWWWPRPAKVLVRWCARLGISANLVTITGAVLMLLSCALFASGHFAAGLLSGWLMTLLDTVDGKLARVTVTSSRLGHVLDHGMDILHPPVWYVLWAYGLASPSIHGFTLEQLNITIVAAYVGGRVLEGAFHALGNCSTFAWRPFDAYFRLVTARRNPCLVMLTLAVLVAQPGAGLVAVAAWSALSTAIIAVRLVQATTARIGGPPLESWLSEPDAARRFPRAYNTFSGTRAAYA